MPIVEIHPHARERAPERGVSEEEIVETVRTGESFPAKFGRMGFARLSSMIACGVDADTPARKSRPLRLKYRVAGLCSR
jgi:hypothetical protein